MFNRFQNVKSIISYANSILKDLVSYTNSILKDLISYVNSLIIIPNLNYKYYLLGIFHIQFQDVKSLTKMFNFINIFKYFI